MGSGSEGRRWLISGAADQALMSFGSLLLMSIAANLLGATGFGQFALAWTFLQIGISATRSLVGETMLARGFKGDVGGPECAALLIGIATALIFAFLATILAEFRGPLFIASCISVFVIAQDSLRFVLIEERRSGTLLLFDALTIFLQFGGILLVHSFSDGIVGVAMGWGGGAIAACVVGSVWLRRMPRFGAGLRFILGSWKNSSAYFAEAVAGSLVGAVTGMAIGWAAGYESLGGYRAALSLMGFTSIAINFVRSVYLRDLRAKMSQPSWSLSATVGRLALLFAIVVVLVSGILLIIPDNLGIVLFGDSWLLAISLIGAAAVNRFTASLSVIPTVILRAQGVTWRAARLRLTMVSSGLVFGPLGAVFGGAAGALLGESITYVTLAFVLLILARREPRPVPLVSSQNPN